MTRQSATGVAKGNFDQATFQLSVEGRGATGPIAKKISQDTIAIVQTALGKLKQAGVIFDTAENQSSFDVSPNYSYKNGESKPTGYIARYTLNLVTKQIDRVSEIQDVLTSIQNLTVSSPVFGMSPTNQQQLQQSAVASAYLTLTNRFKEECRVMGLNPGNFEIDSWSARYSDNDDYPMAYAMLATKSAGQSRQAVGIESGSANIRVSLSVNYRKK